MTRGFDSAHSGGGTAGSADYSGDLIRIRDPIYGNINLSGPELDVIEHPYMQRLRRIKQLGFGEYVYPGATHTRFGHSLGVLAVATRLFDQLLPLQRGLLPETERARFLQSVRLAALLHDVGHAPYSHMGEVLMPARDLVLPPDLARRYPSDSLADSASHEDYSHALILTDALGGFIEQRFCDVDISRRDLAVLLIGEDLWQEKRFVVEGVDWLPLLHQVLSSEIDADRMDYLLRDARNCGVSYGQYDQDWLISNMVVVRHDDAACLGLVKRAIFSFEDFLLSRYHMFITVYTHSRTRAFGRMLQLFFDESGFRFPAEPAAYAALDDVTVFHTLRRSDSLWARMLVDAHGFHPLAEVNSYDEEKGRDIPPGTTEALTRAGILWFEDRSVSILSPYYHGDANSRQPIFVVGSGDERWELQSYTPLFARFAKPIEFHRIFVEPGRKTEARAILAASSSR